MTGKLRRQKLIKEILSTKIISNHEVLLKLLQAEGIKITQATLSRDFADLGILRTTTKIGPRYIVSPNESGREIAKLIGLEIISYQHNGYMVVIRTLAGRAQGVAHFIDRLNRAEILGTIAGDDTVLIIPDSIDNVENLIEIIKQIMTANH